MIDMFLNFLEESSPITLLVIGLLSVYFIAINWVFIYKLIILNNWHSREEEALSLGYKDGEISSKSFIAKFLRKKNKFDSSVLELAKHSAKKDSTRGLSLLSIIASTSPFIGLFGTVVSILETFKNLGDAELGAIAVIAQGVSEALIATAVGIFVATFAYTYHSILKRKAYEIYELLNMQSEIAIINNNIAKNMLQTKAQNHQVYQSVNPEEAQQVQDDNQASYTQQPQTQAQPSYQQTHPQPQVQPHYQQQNNYNNFDNYQQQQQYYQQQANYNSNIGQHQQPQHNQPTPQQTNNEELDMSLFDQLDNNPNNTQANEHKER
jgi:biopolymer transport protein ExbB/TolQ